MADCVYLGEPIDPEINDRRWKCKMHGICTTAPTCLNLPSCPNCKQNLPLDSPDFSTWQDPLLLFSNGNGETNALRGILAKRSVFLACGGPSLNHFPLAALNRRGAWTMTVNNTGGHPKFRPQAMICSDPPIKFSHSIWLDPAIIKFVPTPKLVGRGRGKMRMKQNGKFTECKDANGRAMSICDAPNVWGFKRQKWMRPDESFFLSGEVSLGNYDEGVKTTGEEKTICTMLGAIRLLRYLGAAEVFLLGVDFQMDPDQRYAFEDSRENGTGLADSNNRQFAVANDWLCRLENAGVFKKFGIRFYNCNATSGLRAFPYVPFYTAIERVCSLVEERPDLDMWYQK